MPMNPPVLEDLDDLALCSVGPGIEIALFKSSFDLSYPWPNNNEDIGEDEKGQSESNAEYQDLYRLNHGAILP